MLKYNDGTIKLFAASHTAQEKFETWYETYNHDLREDIIFSEESSAYDIGNRPILKKNLKAFNEDSTEEIPSRRERNLKAWEDIDILTGYWLCRD